MSRLLVTASVTPSPLRLELGTQELALNVAGAQNENLKLLERRLSIRVGLRGTEVVLTGPTENIVAGEKLLRQLLEWVRDGREVFPNDVEQAIKVLSHSEEDLKDVFMEPILTRQGRPIVPRSVAQKRYVQMIRQKDIVFGLGPAGTGKTYLAMATAVAALQARRIKRIILARPAVEAGEKLGFLPGDLAEKVNPYLRPLYDALHDMMDAERAAALMEQGIIEVAPLAFMRGRTLNDAFAILDEAQNTTIEQMKMFLTRLGYNSKAVITGDVTQVDLPTGKMSGLIHAQRILSSVQDIGFTTFSEVDVVRHPLVQEVILAYQKDSAQSGNSSGA